MKPQGDKKKVHVVFSNRPKGHIGIATCHGGEYDTKAQANQAIKEWCDSSPRYSAEILKETKD